MHLNAKPRGCRLNEVLACFSLSNYSILIRLSGLERELQLPDVNAEAEEAPVLEAVTRQSWKPIMNMWIWNEITAECLKVLARCPHGETEESYEELH